MKPVQNITAILFTILFLESYAFARPELFNPRNPRPTPAPAPSPSPGEGSRGGEAGRIDRMKNIRRTNPSDRKGNEDSKVVATQLLNPEFSGSGCPAGSASATLSLDGKTLSVLFDSYKIEAGGAVAMDRKNCQMKLPLVVPANMQVAMTRMDLRGYQNVPAFSNLQILVDYQLFGARRGSSSLVPVSGKLSSEVVLAGPVEEEFFLAAGDGRYINSGCGENAVFMVNSSMVGQVNTRATTENLFVTLDSADIQTAARVDYNLRWQSCTEGRPPRFPFQ